MRRLFDSVSPVALNLFFCLAALSLLNACDARRTTSANNDSNTAVKPLAMMFQVATQFKMCAANKDLASIHNEDSIISGAITEMLASPDLVETNREDSFNSELTKLAQEVGKLHEAGDADNQSQVELILTNVLNQVEVVRGFFSSDAIKASSELADRYTCPMHRDVVGKSTDTCPKCGMQLDQMIRILPADFESPQNISASIRTDSPLVVGQPVTAYLSLKKPDGWPVTLPDLIETHTKKIHLLIIDGSLTDYHHEHPVATDKLGEYKFTFTPRKPGPYRVWADLRPYPLGLQEYAVTDIPADTKSLPLTDRTVNSKVTVDGLTYELTLDRDTVKVGRTAHAKLRITDADGQGFTKLEPIMATFAHIVGFNEDYKTIMHIHPKGAAVLDPNARGGPELEFQIYALKPGFVRLFAQVQVDGVSHFAPFGINIVP